MKFLSFFLNSAADFFGYLLYLTIKGIGRTIRVTIKNHSGRELFKNDNFIFAIWHKNTFLPFYLYRNQNITIFVSNDQKGKILGAASRRLNFDPFPLEENRARSAVKMCYKLRNKQNAVMAVDGPTGPAKHIKDGTQFLSKRTGVPVIATSVHYSSAFTLFWRWDKYQIPFPFSRATVIFSPLFEKDSDWAGLYDALGD